MPSNLRESLVDALKLERAEANHRTYIMDNSLYQVLSNCRYLEILVLDECWGIENVRISSTTVRELTPDLSSLPHFVEEAPNLELGTW